jgi:hypothetical protein
MHGPRPGSEPHIGGGAPNPATPPPRHREPEPPAATTELSPQHLPEWVALRGPEPGWLARNWTLALALISGAALTLNTMLSQRLVSADLYNEVTTAVAWLSTAALFLQSRQNTVNKVAKWRAEERAKAKGGD